VLPDEFNADPDEPMESPVDYFSPRAFWRTLSDTWRPFVAFQVSFELPFGNNVARGRLMQAQASLSRNSVVATNLQRLIGERVIQQDASLERATRELEQRQESLAQHEKAWDGTQELRRAGELTLIDTLLTEQRLTSARLASVRARRGYAAALARLRFETGKLVTYREGRPLSADLSGLVDGPGGASEKTEG
jgi:outer membrane protein TolC